jgi:hypothetical protein
MIQAVAFVLRSVFGPRLRSPVPLSVLHGDYLSPESYDIRRDGISASQGYQYHQISRVLGLAGWLRALREEDW